MDRWVRYNPNPIKGKRVGDCAIRACCKATGRTWDDVYDDLSAIAKHKKDIMSANDVWDDYIEMHGYEMVDLPCRMNVNEFCKEFPQGDYVLGLDEHVVAVSDGRFYDTWDSGGREVLRCWERGRINSRMPDKMRDFIYEIIGVYNKYGLSIAHEDTRGDFAIQKLSRENVEWLKDARVDY